MGRNDGSLSSRMKGRRQEEESSLAVNYLRDKKDFSFDSFTVQSEIYEQCLELQDFDIVNGFLGCLEAQG